jgi:hypothetical protein
VAVEQEHLFTVLNSLTSLINQQNPSALNLVTNIACVASITNNPSTYLTLSTIKLAVSTCQTLLDTALLLISSKEINSIDIFIPIVRSISSALEFYAINQDYVGIYNAIVV